MKGGTILVKEGGIGLGDSVDGGKFAQFRRNIEREVDKITNMKGKKN